MENIATMFQKLGLNEKESATLDLLLSNAYVLPSFAAKKLGINRTTMYDILNSLSTKGLATKITKRGKYFYQTTSPKYWHHYLDQKERRINEQKEILQEIVPELENIYKKSKSGPEVTFYEGLEGVEQAVLDSLDVISNEIIGYSSVSQVVKFLPPRFINFYTTEKIRREIESRFVLKSSQENKDLIENYKSKFYKKDEARKYTPQYRIYMKGKHEIKNEIMIYDDKVMIINILPPHYSATLIKDRDIAEGQRAIFEIAWNAAKNL